MIEALWPKSFSLAATAIQQLPSFDENTEKMVEVEGGCLAKTRKGPLTRKKLSKNISLEPYLQTDGTAFTKPSFPLCRRTPH